MKSHLSKTRLSFYLFYNKDLNHAEAILYSKSFAGIVATNFALLGADMKTVFGESDQSESVLAQLKPKKKDDLL